MVRFIPEEGCKFIANDTLMEPSFLSCKKIQMDMSASSNSNGKQCNKKQVILSEISK